MGGGANDKRFPVPRKRPDEPGAPPEYPQEPGLYDGALRGLDQIDPLTRRQYYRSFPPINLDDLPDGPSGPYPYPSRPRPPWDNPDANTLPPNWKGSLRSGVSIVLELLQAAAWNNWYPGEARIQIDYTRLISFYDPRLTSLMTSRQLAMAAHNTTFGRTWHRLNEISPSDAKLAIEDLREMIKRQDSATNGADWETLVRVVMDRFSQRLELLRDMLMVTPSGWTPMENATVRATRARTQVQVMLSPYLLADALPTDEDLLSGNRSWVEPVYNSCAGALVFRLPPNEHLTQSEVLIKGAIEDVLERICQSLTDIWVDAFAVESASIDQTEKLLDEWKAAVNDLMQWLDWDTWSSCRPPCASDHFCYISTWPISGDWRNDDSEIDLTPRCIHKTLGNLNRDRKADPNNREAD